MCRRFEELDEKSSYNFHFDCSLSIQLDVRSPTHRAGIDGGLNLQEDLANRAGERFSERSRHHLATELHEELVAEVLPQPGERPAHGGLRQINRRPASVMFRSASNASSATRRFKSSCLKCIPRRTPEEGSDLSCGVYKSGAPGRESSGRPGASAAADESHRAQRFLKPERVR